MEKEEYKISSSLKRNLEDLSFEIKIPYSQQKLIPIKEIFDLPIDDKSENSQFIENEQNVNTFPFQLEQPKSVSILNNIYIKLLQELEQLPDISNIRLYFPQSLFNNSQYQFLLGILNKYVILKKTSIFLTTYIGENYMTKWRTFYFNTFLREIMKNQAELSFVTRDKEYERNQNLSLLNNLLTFIQGSYKELKEFGFINGNIEDVFIYPLLLDNSVKIMKSFGNTLEKLIFFFRSYWLNPKEYIPIFDAFEEISQNNKIKSFKIALGGADEPTGKGILAIVQRLKSCLSNIKFYSLNELSVFFANNHLDFYILKHLTIVLTEYLYRLKSFEFLIQTDFDKYSKEEMDEILTTIFQQQANELIQFTLGLCADQGKINRPATFDLKVFGELLKKNQWILHEFNLYFEVNEKGVQKKALKEFLLILTKHQKYLLECRLMIMMEGTNLINKFGYANSLEKYFETKKRGILFGKAMLKMKKKFRIEILNEILETMFN